MLKDGNFPIKRMIPSLLSEFLLLLLQEERKKRAKARKWRDKRQDLIFAEEKCMLDGK